MNSTASPLPARQRKQALVLFALIFALCLPSLWAGMMGDDYMHYAIFEADSLPIEKPDDLSLFGLFSFINGDPDRNRQAMDLGVIPWWTYSGMKYAFWRPIAEVTHWIDYQLWPRMPSLMHLHNLLWYLGICFLLLKLYRRTLPTAPVALIALALYGLDATHGFAISWIANRNGLIAAFFGMAAFLTYIRWREDQGSHWQGLSLLLLLAALLSAEIGISTFGYLAAYAWCCDPKGRAKGILALLPHAGVIIVWYAVYKLAGFGAANADAYYVDPAAQPLTFLEQFGQRFIVLLGSQWGIIPAELYGYGATKTTNYVIGCLVYLLLILPTVWFLTRKHAYTQMWLLGMLCSLVPATTALPQDRVLIFAGIGASAALAHFLYIVFSQFRHMDLQAKWLFKTIGSILVLFHLVISPLLLPVATYSTRLFWSAMISQGPSQFPDIEDLQNKRLVIVGAPLASSLAIAPFRFHRGEPIPRNIWILSTIDEAINFRRLSDTTIEATLPGGFIQGPEKAVRDFARFPFSEGESVKLSGITIRIAELNVSGMPQKLILEFDESTELEDVIFLKWNNQSKSYNGIDVSNGIQ
ncbi:MAG: hypothetical protein R3F47_10420 [Gammaproteobacteria bacterium]